MIMKVEVNERKILIANIELILKIAKKNNNYTIDEIIYDLKQVSHLFKSYIKTFK